MRPRLALLPAISIRRFMNPVLSLAASIAGIEGYKPEGIHNTSKGIEVYLEKDGRVFIVNIREAGPSEGRAS